ncbi:MAG: HRDC domain-containing protein [Caldilineales bacterium]
MAVLRELYIFRDQQASREDRPPFKVFDNRAMIRVATTQPETPAELGKKASLAASISRRYGPGILSAVKRGKHASPPVFRRPSGGNGRPDPRISVRYDALRRWRTERAQQRGVDPDVVLTNDQLMIVARETPASLQQLAATGAMGPWKVQDYGADILDLLARLD